MRKRPSSSPRPGAEPGTRPEHWEIDIDAGDVAQLTIPPDALRDRSFEVFCSLSVDARGRSDAWHAMRVLVDGSMEWQRREATQADGRDSLDYRFHRDVPAGQPLRVVASTEVQLARRLRLLITADED